MNKISIINILDEHIANQIAAGEVIERPASIVKELVENAIDAQASRISVAIKEAGIEEIIVTDNGIGMSEADVKLSIERHATSKIKNNRQLFKIASLGFRGEALPSIAAISHLEIKSRRQDDKSGSILVVEGGNIKKFEPVGAAVGTTIIVRNIFYNTPARLKYLKSITTEANQINEFISKISMAHPHISFSLYHNDRQVLFTPGDGELKNVLQAIYGSSQASDWIEIEARNHDFVMAGYIAKPTITRANRQQINFFVNGRYIKNHRLYYAVLDAYKTLLPINRYPLVALNLTMEYSLVDVNVHPAKLEVRFSKDEDLYQFILKEVKNKLATINLIANIQSNSKARMDSYSKNYSYQTDIDSNIYDKVLEVHEPISNISSDNSYQYRKNLSNINNDDSYSDRYLVDKSAYENNAPTNNLDCQVNEKTSNLEKINRPKFSSHNLRIVGQIHGTYIIAESPDAMLLIDQHAAHERINYENNLTKIKNKEVYAQDMLVPLQLNYSKSEVNRIMLYQEELATIHIEIDSFGDNTIIVRSHPDWVPADRIQDFISHIINYYLVDEKEINKIDLLEEDIIQFSCKSSIKANMNLSFDEMERLLNDLSLTDIPYTCPHGRPVIIEYSIYELEKLFKRIQ